MSQEFTFCPFCGAKNVLNAQFCASCGSHLLEKQKLNIEPIKEKQSSKTESEAQIKATPVSQSTETSVSDIKNYEVEGIVGMVIGILGCIGIVPIIGNVVAIILGHISMKKSENTAAKISLITGYLGIFLLVLIPLIVLIILAAIGVLG